MRKHVCFYSEHCEHSRTAVALMRRLGVTGSFTFISVDVNRASIPPYVTCVPTVVTDQRHVLVGQQLVSFVQAMAMAKPAATTRGLPQPPQQPQAPPVAPHAQEIGAMSLSDGAMFSEGFSFIGGDSEQCADGFCRGFVFVDEDVRIQHPASDGDTAARKRSEQQPAYNLDQLVSDREKMIV